MRGKCFFAAEPLSPAKAYGAPLSPLSPKSSSQSSSQLPAPRLNPFHAFPLFNGSLSGMAMSRSVHSHAPCGCPVLHRTLPAGYAELGETTAEGAARETWEEVNARVEGILPYFHIDIPRIGQVSRTDPETLLDVPAYSKALFTIPIRYCATANLGER
eukprot:1176071-Prorocentrum_minimum.AAC.2